MPKLQKALKLEVAPAWIAFLRDAIPYGEASSAAAVVNGEASRGDWAARSSKAASLRRLIDGRIGQPMPHTVWAVAETARGIEGCAWCAGPLFLFAAGHFERFAQTLSYVNPNLLTKPRLRQMLETVEAACTPSTDSDDERFATDLRAQGIADTIIQNQLRRRRRRNFSVRPERNAWILSDQEEAGLTQSFLQGREATSLSTITARLAEMHPEIGLCHQRAIAINGLKSLCP